MKKCLKCKYCYEVSSQVTLAYGGQVYQCALGKGKRSIVGYHDLISQKSVMDKTIKRCEDYCEQIPIKNIEWTNKLENKHTFELESNIFLVKGGDKDSNQSMDKSWFVLKVKYNNAQGIFYLENEYKGKLSPALTKEIEMIILRVTKMN